MILCSSLDSDVYLSESERQIFDRAIYQYISFNEKILTDLLAGSKSLERKETESEKEVKYLFLYYKNATNLGTLYFLLKVYKTLFVPDV